MKRILLIMLCVILLVGTVSAVDWDNKLSYSNEDLKVTIRNSILGLIPTSEIGTAELKSHSSVDEVVKYGAGNQVTMWYEFSDFKEPYEGGLGKVYFTDERTGKTIERNYSFVYWGEKERNIYGDGKCVFNINGTQTCERVVIGKETYDDWVDYSSKDIPKENIRIGLLTYVEIDDKIDGVWTIAGKKVKKHAVWTASLNVDLLAYYKFDDNADDSHTNSYDLTEFNTPTYTTGKLGNAIDLEKGTDQYLERSVGDLYPTLPFSVNVWVKPETVGNNDNIIVKASSSAARMRYHIINAGTDQAYVIVHNNAGSSVSVISSSSLQAGVWTMITLVANGTDLKLYFNGSSEGTPLALTDLDNTAEQPLRFGTESHTRRSTYNYDGIIDEVGIWNRTLTPAEVTQLYNGGAGITYPTTTPPTSTLNSPDDLATVTNPNIIFNATGTDNHTLQNMSLIVNGSYISTNSSPINNTPTLFPYTFPSTSYYNWTVEACDNEDTCVNATTRGITYTNNLAVTLNAPINAFNSSLQTIVFNGTGVDDTNLINMSFILNSVYNGTNVSVINNTLTQFPRTLVDGSYNWTLEVCDIYTCLNATTRNFTIDTTPLIQFENPTPINYYNSSSSYVPVNVSLTETYFKNITFSFYNNTLTEFYYEDSTRFINKSLADGIYSYNVTVWTTTDQTNSTETRNITIDATNPIITTNSSITFDHQEINTNLTIYFNVTEIHPDTCLYDYNGTNISIGCGNTSVIINTTTLTNRNIIFYANDTFERETILNVAWNYTIFENSQTFNDETFEGIINTFVANVTIIESNSITIANLIYNGTSYSNSFSQSGNDFILTIDFLVPNVNTDTNLTFFWSLTLLDGQIINLTSHNQTVITLKLDDCSVNTIVLYNYTIVDEGNQSLLSNPSNTTAELNINLLDITRQNYIVNFSKKYLKINPFAVCINKNLSSSTYVVDSVVKYEAIGYSVEYYNIVNATITNSTIPQDITLYDLFSADTTEFKITFKAEDFTFVENALIYIDRQYIAENNTFKTVELPKTDSNGQTVGHFVRNDIVYNIRVIKGGVVLGNFKNIIAFCEDYTIGNCQMVLEAIPEDFTTFDYDEQLGILFQTLPTYNENTSSISFDFSTDDGTIKTVLMEVTRNDIFGNRSICNNTLTSSSGTLTCSFDPNIDDSVLGVDIFVDNQPVVMSNVRLESSDYGNLGYVLWFFLTFLFVLLFGHSKTEVLIGLSISFMGAISLGITRGNIIGLGSAGIWVLVIMILGIVKLNKDRPQ